MVAFTRRGLLVKESIGTAYIPVTRKNGADGEVSVKWRTIDKTAINNKDFKGDNAEKLFQEFGIDQRRVTVLKQPPAKSKTYARDSVQQVTDFFQLYVIDNNHHILSDGGASFKKKSESIFDDLPFKKAEGYPAPVNQYLSPNDNRLHGVAKARWRAKVKNWKDDVRNTLLLMKELDKVEQASIKGWFDTNLQLKEDEATAELAERCIFGDGSKSKRKFKFFEQCEKTMETFETKTRIIIYNLIW